MGLFHALGRAVAPDPVLAVAWITVARENGAPATPLLDTLKRHMSAEAQREALRLAEDVRRRCGPD